ncbi:MAG: hemolysin III family protein [Planctomycetes bacterium]|nr:hemolysin III family protein [Planctomycetota bacterium]
MYLAILIAQEIAQEVQERLTPIPGFADPVSSLSHLVATAVFAFASISLLRSARGHRGRMVALSIYAGSVVLLFSMSGVFHLLSHQTTGRAVLQRLDHASIFVLIAGTFTAVHGILFRGWLRWGIIAFVWIVTATAIPLKTVFFEEMPEWLGLTLYLAFPWIGLLSGFLLWRQHGMRYVATFVLGGIAYTVGAVLEFLRWPNPVPGTIHAHELFHFFAIAGAAFHWRFCADIAAAAAAAERSAIAS